MNVITLIKILSGIIFVELIIIVILVRLLQRQKVEEAERWWLRCCNPKATLYDLEQLEAVLRINKISSKQKQIYSETSFSNVQKGILTKEIEEILQNPKNNLNAHTYKNLKNILTKYHLSLQDLNLNSNLEEIKILIRKIKVTQVETDLESEFQKIGLVI